MLIFFVDENDELDFKPREANYPLASPSNHSNNVWYLADIFCIKPSIFILFYLLLYSCYPLSWMHYTGMHTAKTELQKTPASCNTAKKPQKNETD